MIRITNLKLELDQAIHTHDELAYLKKKVMSLYQLCEKDIRAFTLYKKAIDARKKQHIYFVYTVDVEINNETVFFEKKHPNTTITPMNEYHMPEKGFEKLKQRPVVIGFGPSGIFAAWLLAKNGYQPIVLERGCDVETRAQKVENFFKTGSFDESGTILFGEGGAGTFSDGKLYTLINDLRCRTVLEILVQHGASPEILYLNKPHVGTDVLRSIIKMIRQDIITMGGEIRFESNVTGFVIEDRKLKSVIINHSQLINTSICLLGIGHSARDTFQWIYDSGLHMTQKPFSMGVRIEHPQSIINVAQYGKYANHPALGPAEYKLSYHGENNRTAYTFCMCPGGYVVNSASEPGGCVTNGMSESRRDGTNANAGFLVNIDPSDFGSNHPLAGIEFQRKYERSAFQLAKNPYYAPTQLVGDFMNDLCSEHYESVQPTYQPGTTFVKMTDILPKYVTDTLKAALIDFDRKIKGFAMKDAILTGVETRSSSPVRIVRNENHESNITGIYPMGEGAGYAGGIMSSAVDGIKTAEKVISCFQSFK